MTPQERQLIDDLFDRLSKLEGSPRDAAAEAAIRDGLRRAPNATYALVQTVLVQDEALKRANAHIEELEAQGAGQQQSAASSIPCAMRLDRASPRVWCPTSARPMSAAGRSGFPGHRPCRRLGGPGRRTGIDPRRRAAAAAVPGGGGGGSFLGTAAATARHGRRFAAARRHPLHEGRRRQHLPDTRGLDGSSGGRPGDVNPAQRSRMTPGSATSARPAAAATSRRLRLAGAFSSRPRTMLMTTRNDIDHDLTV
jgi:hypothetical protein